VWRPSAPFDRILKLVTSCAFVVTLHTGFVVAADTKGQTDPRQAYRFVVTAEGGGTTTIRGLITVDGKDRLIEREQTPFEFRCEAGSVVAGYFEARETGRSLKLRVFDPAYSRRRSALSMSGLDHIRFSWAQPGVGPRCADSGMGACPSSTPSVEEFRRRLGSLREAG